MLNRWIVSNARHDQASDWMSVAIALAATSAWSTGVAQQTKLVTDTGKPAEVYVPIPGFDTTSLDKTVDPCNDFYKFACGKFAANHPIPADQPGVDQFYALYNVNTQALNGILNKAAAGGAGRSPDEQKIGDYYKACMDTDVIEAKGLAPIEPLLNEIDALKNKEQLAALAGKLQRIGVNVFFGYGEQQDFKDASKQIAIASQGGLGLPEKDYYLRTGAKDVELREQYVAHVAKMLELAGSSPEKAKKDAQAIMAFETSLAKASMGVTEMRDPEKIYHLQPIATFEATMPGMDFGAFEDAMHSPRVSEINNATPEFFPAADERDQCDRPGDAEGLYAVPGVDDLGSTIAEAVRCGELRLLRTQAGGTAGAGSAVEALLEFGEQCAG